ncbi:MAG TPA: phosphate ABC transporter substrate-binding protein PstS [Acidimicrobiales bacterium]|nr:phosphate ABC transporter substrate-binding protein PstS [Acidimicrobiales bacterium]
MKTRQLVRIGALVVALALTTAACKSKDANNSSTATTAGGNDEVKGLSIDYANLSATLNASGSTFQANLQEAAKAGFLEVAPKVTVNYAGGGSGKGKTDLQGQVVDFAGSDSLIKPEEKASYKGGEVLYFPIAAAPITVAYQLSGVSKLQLSADTIAKIFQVQITKWDDPAIKADNPGVTLPSTNIVVVHRAEGSGTTSNFTGYLTKAAPTAWTLGKGDTVNWPASTQAGSGNQGVAQLIGNGTGTLKGTDGAIGYVDFADAKATNLKTASIKNAAGKFVAPSLAGVSAALEETTPAADLTFDPLNAAGDSTYPIATPTWILVYKNQTDKAKGEALKGFLNYILTDGQALNQTANYASLPASYRTKAIAQLKTLVIPTA